MRTLIYRHLLLFIKNPASILLSFLSSLVILSLYFLFIRDFTIKAVSEYGFVSNYNNLFVDKLMTSGLLIVIGATSVIPIILLFVKDKCSGILKDFLVTPISKIKIIYSYIITTSIVSIIITLTIYFFIELFFILKYSYYSTLSDIISSILLILISNIIASNIIFVISLFIKSFTSFTTFETLYGVVIGFFTGVYIPIGYYPNIIRNIFFYFPLCQTTSMLRYINTSRVSKLILDKYPTNTHNILYETFGVKLSFNNNIFQFNEQVLFVSIFLLIINLVIIFYIKFINK